MMLNIRGSSSRIQVAPGVQEMLHLINNDFHFGLYLLYRKLKTIKQSIILWRCYTNKCEDWNLKIFLQVLRKAENYFLPFITHYETKYLLAL